MEPESLFRVPFVTGALLAVVLPVLGMYLRLRDEWLAALAYAQLAAAGSLVAALFAWPLAAGALAAAALAAFFRNRVARTGNDGHALLMLAGWGAALVLIANLPAAEQQGHALFEGQLYFSGTAELWTALALGVAALGIVPAVSRVLLAERALPGFMGGWGAPVGRAGIAFDLLVAAGIAAATGVVGVMAAFGLVFIPPLICYRIATGWRSAVALAAATGLATYALAFGLALWLDQPFGPMLALVLVAASLPALAWRRPNP